MSHDRTEKPVVCRDMGHEQGHEIQRQNSESEQIRTLLDRQREQILADCQAEGDSKDVFQADYDRRSLKKLSETIESQKEELHRAQAEESRRQDHQLLHEPLLKQNWDLREAHEKSLNEMKELKRFQGSTCDTIARRKFPNPATFAWWKIRFKTEVCTCSQFPTEALHWIKEVEIVDSLDDLKCSSSVKGIRMPDFEVLGARIASALNRIIHNSHFKEESVWRNRRPRSRTVSFAKDRLLT